jgi:cell wall-associated NlpC family hydrolase
MNLSSARRLLVIVAMLVAALLTLPSPVAAGAAANTEAQQIVSTARNELGGRYSFSATGPSSFDCSGLVYFVYKQAGLLDRIGGKRRTVAGYHNWFNKHGTVTKSLSSAQVGDVLVWGKNKHTGIYIGNGKAISALVNPWGVTEHKVVGYIHMKLTAVLHVKLER